VTVGEPTSEVSKTHGTPQSLRGRAEELARLYRMVDDLSHHGGAIVVRGEAGIGKSALLAATSRHAHDRGAMVLSASGVESEAQFPFAGLHQLLRPSLSLLPRLPEPQRHALEMAFGLGSHRGVSDVFLIGLATLGLVSELATETPVLLVVDDAHWLDRSSSKALAFVARRLEMEPAVLLLAVRDEVSNDIDEAGLAELRVGRLDSDASRALLDVTGAGLSEDLKGRILEAAAGNPLALTELPIAVSGLKLEPTSGVEALPLTMRLERAFAARLGSLDGDARALLLLAALDEAEPDRLMAAAEILRGGAIRPDGLAPAVAAGLGELADEGFHFRHPLVRSAVEQTASPEERRRAHAALAEALADDPDRAAWHAAGAAAGPDEEAAARTQLPRQPWNEALA
jgi:AAA ATPase domain